MVGFSQKYANRIVIFLISFLFVAFFTKTDVAGWNDASRLDAVQAIVEHHTFVINNTLFETGDKVIINGKFYSDKAALSYLILVPVYYLLYKMGLNFSNSPHLCYYLITLFTMGLSFSIMLVYFFRLMALFGLSPKEQFLHTAAVGLGTLVFPYSLVINNHSLAASFLLMGFYCILVAKTDKQHIFAGLIVGLTASFDEVTGAIFLAVFIILLLLRSNKRNFLFYMGGALIPIVLYLLVNLYISGSIIPFHLRGELFNYPGSPFQNGEGVAGLASRGISDILHYAWGVTLGEKGFLRYTPLLFFSLAGLAFSIIRRNKYRNEAILVAVGIIATLVFFIIKTDQYGGCNYGFRYMVPIIPILYAFTPFLFKEKDARPCLKLIFWIALIFSVFISGMGIIQNPLGCNSEMIPNIPLRAMLYNIYHSIALFQ